MSNEGLLRSVPTEGTDTKLNDSKFLSRVFDFEVTNVEAVELERLAPGGAGDARHFEVHGHEDSVSDDASEVTEGEGLKGMQRPWFSPSRRSVPGAKPDISEQNSILSSYRDFVLERESWVEERLKFVFEWRVETLLPKPNGELQA